MKVNISPSKGWTVQPKKTVNKKTKAKLNTAAKKTFFNSGVATPVGLAREMRTTKTFGAPSKKK